MRIKLAVVIAIAFILALVLVGGGRSQSITTITIVTEPCGFSNSKLSAPITGSGGPQQLVTPVAGKSIFVCGFALGNWAGSNKFSYGTSSDCLLQTGTLLTGNVLAAGNPAAIVGNNGQTVLHIPAGFALCTDNGAQGLVTYVQQ